MLEYIEEGWGRGSRGGVGGGVDREGGTRVTLTRGGLRNLQRSTLVNVGCCLCGQRLPDHASSPHLTSQ